MELTHNPAYDIQEIDGLDPAQAVINATRNAGQDGSTFNSAYVQERQITITLVINKPAEANRIALYRFFKPKFPVRLYYSNGERDVYIDGYTQTVMVDFFAKKEAAQITVICPRPYFQAAEDQLEDISSVVSLFEFPFSIAAEGIPFSELDFNTERVITNMGDVDAGIEIVMHARGAVQNPRIYNVQTQEALVLNVTMEEGDTITINTGRGEKVATLLRDGVETSIAGKIAEGSTWLQLAPGDSLINTIADVGTENLEVYITFRALFEGV
jgi:phage-related protein